MATTPMRARPLSRREHETLLHVTRTIYPHASFPDTVYERAVETLVDAAASDPRFEGQLRQALSDLDALSGMPFTHLEADRRLELLRTIADSDVFEQIRGRLVTGIYDQAEVWELLGYEGPSFASGGYLHRGFDDLDWLPDPQIVDPRREEIVR